MPSYHGCLHERDIFHLIVVYGFEERRYRRTEKGLMDVFHLILTVWDCVDIRCRLRDVCSPSRRQVERFYAVFFVHAWRYWIHWESP